MFYRESDTVTTTSDTSIYGQVWSDGNEVVVDGRDGALSSWARRPGQSWPCSTLARYDRVRVEIDIVNGDLLDIACYLPGERWAEDSPDVDGSELTAWVDDCLASTPFAHLARNVGEAV